MEKKTHYINTLTYQLEATTRLCFAFMQDWFDNQIKNRVSFEDYIILDTLVCYSHLDSVLLARTLYKEESSVIKTLNKLEKKKLIKKVTDGTPSGRFKTYEITDEGCRVYGDISNIKDELIRLFAKFISENELICFTKTLLKIKGIMLSLNDKESFFKG